MISDFDQELGRRLDAIRAQGLWRELRRVDSAQGARVRLAGREFVNFSSNDYLGLANHPALREAAARALEQFGAGSGASRLICGSLAPHHELDEALAAFKGTEAALSFSSGYATAVGAITALCGKDDIIVLDKLVHACIVDAARLSGAKLRIFAHNDLGDLEGILRWARETQNSKLKTSSAANRPGILVVTESVFSMDGDQVPLRELVALKERFGAWLMVDEAHATGLFGARRRGLAEEVGVTEQIEIQMGTLGKALGTAGGYVCGSRRLIEFLVNRARSFIFSTAPVPAAAAAARAAVELVQSATGESLRQTLWKRLAQCAAIVASRKSSQPAARPPSAILPILIGDEADAVSLAAALRERGVFIPAIRYPTVARGAARLRITVTAAHTASDLVSLTEAWCAVGAPHPITPPAPPRDASTRQT